MTLNTFFILITFVIFSEISGEKFIINTDAGVDDALAILLMLRYEASRPKNSTFKILAITCSYGNEKEEQIEKNVLKILTVAGRSDIPVYAGAHRSFIESWSSDNFFGNDSLGDFNFNLTITAKVNKSKHAAVALVDMVKSDPGNVSIVSLGPLTNIGLAIALDQNFTNNVRRFYVMGGSVSGDGNKRPGVEFNFAADPESNLMLFNAANKAQIVQIPLGTTQLDTLTKKWREDVLGKYDSPYVNFLNKAESVSLAKDDYKWDMPDGLVAACIVDKTIIKSQIVRNVDPVVDGKARGSVLVDYNIITGKVKNTVIVQAINVTLYQELLIQYLTCKIVPC